MAIELEVEYPATTRKPRPSGEGMVVHEYLDVSMYMGMPEGDRYVAAGDDNAKRRAALAAMPKATIKFFELPVGEPFFVMLPDDFFDRFPDLDDERADDPRPGGRVIDVASSDKARHPAHDR